MKCSKIFVLSVVGVLLLCSVASAIEVTPYLKLSREYAANPFKAKKEWIGKEICIEGEIANMNTTDNGDAVIVLNKNRHGKDDPDAKYETVIYFFYFDGIPDEVTSVEEGEWAKISGRIYEIRRKSDGGMNALLIDVALARIVY